MSDSENMLFIVEYFDPMPQIKKTYLLKYFPDSHAVEMVDVRTKKLFLKKSPCPPELSAQDFRVGQKVYLYARELDIVDYGDGKTREMLHHQMQKGVAIISSDVYQDWGSIISHFEKEMNLIRIKSVVLSDSDADRVVAALEMDRKFASSLTRGTNLVVVFEGEGGCSTMNAIVDREGLGSTGGVLTALNGVQTSVLIESLITHSKTTATLDSCTCCVIKPHIVKSGNVGSVVDIIVRQGYEISAADSFQFDKGQSEEFLEVYKGVVPEYPDHVVQLCAGLSVSLELRAENAVEVFRETAGPWDLDMARELRPNSIRAKFGADNIRSAVHCTDLASDGQLECEYCFHIVAP